jgi:hypothetical protein
MTAITYCPDKGNERNGNHMDETMKYMVLRTGSYSVTDDYGQAIMTARARAALNKDTFIVLPVPAISFGNAECAQYGVIITPLGDKP